MTLDTTPLLELRAIDVAYGGIRAVRGLDLVVNRGELVSLIGANGAGKSTTLRAICGLVPLAGGDVFYDGRSIAGLPSYMLVRQGLVMVPEGRGIFGQLTIEENLAMGAYSRRDTEAVRRDTEHVLELFPRLRERLKQSAGTLSGGEQQMLAMGRAMISRPRLLLLDEPSMGLAPLMVEKIFEVIRAIADDGVTILLIEQNARLALEASHRGYVMESGRMILEGPSQKLLDDPKVRAAYLGEEEAV
jgi:branched-chain amino acid transport system ATP-binding protein